MVRRSCIGMPARPGPPNSRFRLAASPYSLAMCRKMSLPLTVFGLTPVEFVADGRRDLEPGGAGAHDRIHLGRPQPAGRGVVGAGGAGVRVGAGQYFSGSCQPVLGDDLVADAVPADVVEALDAEVGDEFSGMLAAGGVLDGRSRDGVVHDDGQLVGVVDPVGLDPHRGELQIDQHGHIDVDHDGVAGRHRVQAGLAREDLLDDGHAHDAVLRCVRTWRRGPATPPCRPD